MKTAYTGLAGAGIILVFAACHSWAGGVGAEHAAAPPAVSSRDTISFVEGPDAEPPALPANLPMPKSAAAPVSHPVVAAADINQSPVAAPKESVAKGQETPKSRPPSRHIRKDTVTAAEVQKGTHAAILWGK